MNKRCFAACLVGFLCACTADELPEEVEVSQSIGAVGTNATPASADYDGDGIMDFALRDPTSGTWYIDLAKCDPAPGSGGIRRCVGPNGFGGRWDFAYEGYGGGAAVPVPADYGLSTSTSSLGVVDNEHKADISAKDSNGFWYIDYADNGFGVWDKIIYSPYFVGSAEIPVPADYDGDGIADLAVKDSQGFWRVDVAKNGFGTIDYGTGARGNAAAIPVPADYDGDGCADLAVKDPYTTAGGQIGTWYIDYAAVPGQHCGPAGWGSWNAQYSAYGGATAIPVPADYDGDGRADLAVKDYSGSGTWYIDYSNVGGFGAWNAVIPAVGNSSAIPIPGHYDPSRPGSDRRVDLATIDTGNFRVNLTSNGYGPSQGWDTIPGTSSSALLCCAPVT